MSLLARNALVLGSERRITLFVDGNKWQQKSDGLIKRQQRRISITQSNVSKRECNSKKKTATSSVTKASTKRIAH